MTYATIQSAANDMTCNEIVIAAGTYTEQVTVGRMGSIYVHGAGAGRTIIKSPATRAVSTLPTMYHPNYTYVIQIPPGTGADFADLSVDALGNGSCAEDLFAIRFNNSNGSLQNVTVENVRSTGAAFGCQNNIAIAATGDGGGASTVSMNHVSVRNFQKVGILYNGNASGRVENSVVRGAGAQNLIAQNGIQVSRGAVGQLFKNVVADIHFTGNSCLGTDTQVGSGVIFYQAGEGGIMVDNVLTNVDRGIFLRECTGTHTILHNRVINAYAGITSEANAAGKITLTDNRVVRTTASPALNAGTTCFLDTGNSFSIINESGTTVSTNWAADASRNNLDIFPTATGTATQQSFFTRGTRFDLEDRGVGSTHNSHTCRTSSPANLCTFVP